MKNSIQIFVIASVVSLSATSLAQPSGQHSHDQSTVERSADPVANSSDTANRSSKATLRKRYNELRRAARKAEN